MKRCPECRRDYYDDTLLYCLDDGNALLEGPASQEARTEILPKVPDDRRTRIQNPQVPDTSDEGAADPEKSSGADRRFLRGKWRPIVASVAVGILGLSIVVGLWILQGGVRPRSGDPFRHVSLKRVTNEGNVGSVTISPDGKYIAYSTFDGDASTMWTKHLATGSRVQIAQQANSVELYPCTFTIDGNYLIYSTSVPSNSNYDVYQVPVLGGASRKLLTGTTGIVSISPNGREMAFVRFDDKTMLTSIRMANIDGTDERNLTTRAHGDMVAGFGASWAPDGQDLVSGHYASGVDDDTLVKINIADGQISPFAEKKFNFLGLVKWLSDGSGVVLIGKESAIDNEQVWYVSASDRNARKITSDLNAYQGASLAPTADAKTLVVLQHQMVPSVYLASTNELNSISRVSLQNDGASGLNWDSSGRLFFVSGVGSRTTWVLEPNARAANVFLQENSTGGMVVTPDGRYSVFESNRGGSVEIWRADIDGSNPINLTSGANDVLGFAISPDGRWVAYSLFNKGLWTVPIEGGIATKLDDDRFLLSPQFSPDGTRIAGVAWDSEGKKQIRIFKIDGDTTRLVKSIEMSSTGYAPLRWSSDGRTLIFINTIGRVSNLWQQPLDGGKSKQITNYTSDQIVDFAFSSDGKQIALARGPTVSDAVLITDQGDPE